MGADITRPMWGVAVSAVVAGTRLRKPLRSQRLAVRIAERRSGHRRW